MAGSALNRVVADFKCAATGDPHETLCRKFDVIKEKALYGRKFMGIERSTFLVDEKGKLREEWHEVKVKAHAATVLEAVKNC